MSAPSIPFADARDRHQTTLRALGSRHQRGLGARCNLLGTGPDSTGPTAPRAGHENPPAPETRAAMRTPKSSRPCSWFELVLQTCLFRKWIRVIRLHYNLDPRKLSLELCL